MPSSPLPNNNNKAHKRRSSFARLLLSPPDLLRSTSASASTSTSAGGNPNVTTPLDNGSSNSSNAVTNKKKSGKGGRSPSPSIRQKRRPSNSSTTGKNMTAQSSSSTSTWNSNTIDLDAQAMERFITLTLYDQVHLEDNGDGQLMDLMDHLQCLAEDLSEHYVALGHKLCNQSQQLTCPHCSHARLDEIVHALQTCLKESQSLPPEVTAEVHSAMGLLRQKQGNFAAAIQSFLKVLWIQSSLSINAACNTSCPDVSLTDGSTTAASSRRSSARSSISSISSTFSNSLNLSSSFGNLFALETTSDDAANSSSVVWKTAMTKHRLGMAYGRNQQFDSAIAMLEKAISDYHESFAATSSSANNHTTGNTAWSSRQRKIVDQAKTALANMQEARALLEATSSCASGRDCSGAERHAARCPKRASSTSLRTTTASYATPPPSALRRNKTVDSQAPFFAASSTASTSSSTFRS